MNLIELFKKKKTIVPEKSLTQQYPELKNVIASIALNGDISELNRTQRVLYYTAYCKSLGLNALAKPFDIIELKGKTILYPNKECAAQLRELKGVSIDKIHTEKQDDMYIVVVKGHDKTGKTDCEIASVPVEGLKGESLCNAMMKATTKAKRRLTLSLCGLGSLDETEIEDLRKTVNKEVQPTEYSTDNLTLQEEASEKEEKVIKEKAWDQLISFINKNQKKLTDNGFMPSDIIKKARGQSEEDILRILKEIGG